MNNDSGNGNRDEKANALSNDEKNETEEEGYEWSDSDSESSDTGDHDPKNSSDRNYLTQSTHNALDEFASAVQDEAEEYISETSDIEDKDDGKVESIKPESFTLEDDVNLNLTLLAQLYPDMKVDTSSKISVNEKEQKDKNEKFGFTMQRYDPTAEPEIDYENNQDSTASSDAPSNESSDDDEPSDTEIYEEKVALNSQSINSKDNDDVSIQNNDAITNAMEDNEQIYEQKKLEDVFQQKRSGGGRTDFQLGFQFDLDEAKENRESASDVITKAKENDEKICEQKKLEDVFQQKRSGGGRTDFQLGFQFDLDGTKENIKSDSAREASGNFSFSFDTSSKNNIESTLKSEDTTNSTKNGPSTNPQSMDVDSNENEKTIVLPSRMGLNFSASELSDLESKFFNMNEGVDEILAMMDDTNKKESDEAIWEEERNVLTLDWKRKQKYAQSRKNKKMTYSR